jgi:hypothetical protein
MSKNTELKLVGQPVEWIDHKGTVYCGFHDNSVIQRYLKGVGRNPIGDGRKKGGLKVHSS